MANVQYYDVILKPVVTEKSMNAMSEKKYTFLVHTEANKSMIKEAVEKMFPGTKVKSVNTMNLDGKTKRRGMTFGKTAKRSKSLLAYKSNAAWLQVTIRRTLCRDKNGVCKRDGRRKTEVRRGTSEMQKTHFLSRGHSPCSCESKNLLMCETQHRFSASHEPCSLLTRKFRKRQGALNERS